ncbi:MAG: hypothetical protein ACE5QF_08430 [Thermoplasmata archaeon]
MPEEEEIEEAVNSIRDLSEVAELAPCPNCGEVTPSAKNVCESCGFLIRAATPAKESPIEDEGFKERLTMTLKPVAPSSPKAETAETESEEPKDAFPELTELERSFNAEKKAPKEALPRVVSTRASVQIRKWDSHLVGISAIIVFAGIITYLLSFLLVSDRVLAGAVMILGAVIIVIFGNVAMEGALASRRPVLVAAEEPRRKMVQYICPVCKTPLREEESRCPLCGSVFES